METKALLSLIILNAALTYAIPQSSNPTGAGNNTTHPIALQNTTSVFPTPSHAPNTSSTEFRIFLSFLIFGSVAGAMLLLYPCVLFALHLRGRKRGSSDSASL
jgi:hypothetical protein